MWHVTFQINCLAISSLHECSDCSGCPGLGVVEAHGEGAGKLEKGTRVVTIWPTWPVSQGNGTWQQYICVPEDILVNCGFLST